MDCIEAPGPTRLGTPCTVELVKSAKSAALWDGITLGEWVKRAVEEKLGRIPPVKVVDLAPEPVPESKAGSVAACDTCGAPCVAWGPKQRHCTKCSRNHPL